MDIKPIDLKAVRSRMTSIWKQPHQGKWRAIILRESIDLEIAGLCQEVERLRKEIESLRNDKALMEILAKTRGEGP